MPLTRSEVRGSTRPERSNPLDRVLPPYSPGLNPIEMAFSKLKTHLRKAAERTVEGLYNAIARIFETFQPRECRSDFVAAGYAPT